MDRLSSRIKKTFPKIHLLDKLNKEQKNESRNDKISTLPRQTHASGKKKAKNISKEESITKVNESNASHEENVEQSVIERVASSNVMTVICKSCNEKFSSQESYHAHICEEADKTQYICRPCSKEFSSFGNLIRHRKYIHNGRKDYFCNTCKKWFAEKSALEVHRRIHTGERPYLCDICHRAFAQKSNLSTHIKSHIRDFSHQCAYCGNKFMFKNIMLKHLTVHTGVKNFMCDLCNKYFKTNHTMKRHKTIAHSKERPFLCKCGKRYKRQDYLRKHKRRSQLQICRNTSSPNGSPPHSN